MKKRLIFIILIIALLVTSLTACAALDDSISKPGTVVINVTRLAPAQNAELSFSSTNGDITIDGDKATIAVSSRKTFQVTISSSGFKTETVTVNTADFKDDTATFAVEFGKHISSEFSLYIMNDGVVPTVDNSEGVTTTFADGTLSFTIDNIYNDNALTIRANGYEPMIKKCSELQLLKQLYFVHEDNFLVTLNTDRLSNPVVLDERHNFYLPKKISSSFYFELPQSDTLYSFDNSDGVLNVAFKFTTVYDTNFKVMYEYNNNQMKYTTITKNVYDAIYPYLYRSTIFAPDDKGLLTYCQLEASFYDTNNETVYELRYPANVDTFLILSDNRTEYMELTIEELINFSPDFQSIDKFYTRPELPFDSKTLDFKVFYQYLNPENWQIENVYVDCVVDGLIDNSLLTSSEQYYVEYTLDGHAHRDYLYPAFDPQNNKTYYIDGVFINTLRLAPYINITTDIYDKNDNIIYHDYSIYTNLLNNNTFNINIDGYSLTTIYYSFEELQHLSDSNYTFKTRKIYINSNYRFNISINNMPQDEYSNNYLSNIIIEEKSYLIGNNSYGGMQFVCVSKIANVSFRMYGKKYSIIVNFDDNYGRIDLDYYDLINSKS